jgi:hypothetical protein
VFGRAGTLDLYLWIRKGVTCMSWITCSLDVHVHFSVGGERKWRL